MANLSQDVLVVLPEQKVGETKILFHPEGVFTLISGERCDIIFPPALHDIIAMAGGIESALRAVGLYRFIKEMGREEWFAAYTCKVKTGPEPNRLFALFELKG